MNIKKFITIALSAVTTITSMSSVILAEDATPTPATQSGTTTVTYTVKSSWEWDIPTETENIDLTGGEAKQATVGIKNAEIEAGKQLKITATGSGEDGAFTLSYQTYSETVNTIPYTVKIVEGETKTEVSPGDTLFIYSSTTPSVTLEYQVVAPKEGEAFVSGTYTGKVTYIATLETKTAQD